MAVLQCVYTYTLHNVDTLVNIIIVLEPLHMEKQTLSDISNLLGHWRMFLWCNLIASKFWLALVFVSVLAVKDSLVESCSAFQCVECYFADAQQNRNA